MQKNGLGKYVDAGEIATLVTEKTDRILASKHRTNWKPPVADPEGIEQRTFQGIKPVTYRRPKKPRGLKGQAIPYASKFYRSTMYEPEPFYGMKEKMSWV